MARILVVIDGDSHVRNMLRTDALRAVMAAHECSFVASDTTVDRAPLESLPGSVHWFGTDPEVAAQHTVLFDALMWRYRRRSRTFLYRWLRISGYRAVVRDRGRWIHFKSTLRWLQALPRRRHAIRAVILGTEPLHTVARRILARRIPVNPELERLVTAGDHDLVIHPSSAYEATGSDLVRITRGTRTRVLALIDNWDNLSSKTVLWARPDHLGVWGEQSRRHAIEIQGIPPRDISILGTPRFDGYFTARAQRPPSPYPFPYILFVGAALAVDELAVLRLLDDTLADGPGLQDDLRVVYRPHPLQQRRAVPAVFEPDRFRRVVLDAQFVQAAKDGRIGADNDDFQPDLGWYPPLLTNATLVMGPLTTMLLEGSLCHRPVLALAHDDGIHFTTPAQALRWYRHFEGIEKVAGLTLCHDLADLPRAVEQAIAAGPPDPAAVDASLADLILIDERPYPERLLEVVDRMLSASPM